MEQFDAAIIGFGTAGLALGGALADDGQNIVVVENCAPPRANATTARWPIARTSTSSTAAHRSRTPRT